MGTDNKSISYNQDREAVRRFLLNNPDGRLGLEMLKMDAKPGDLQRLLDDDNYTDHEELLRELKGGIAVAQTCKEAREAFAIDTAGKTGARWLKFFSPPLGYYLRRQVDTADPDYWNSPINMIREALAHPLWACAPEWFLRGELAKLLPRNPKSDALVVPEPFTAPTEPPVLILPGT